MEKSVMIIEDEISLAKILSYDLRKSGYTTTIYHDGQSAEQAIPTAMCDFYIIDWMLPKKSGIELIPLIRHHHPNAYIVMTSAKEDELSRIEGLESGADHYMAKPISHRELLAHLSAFIRRNNPHTQNDVIKSLDINTVTRTVTFRNQPIELTKLEFDLLVLFTSNPKRVYSRDYLLNSIWGFTYDGSSRIVDVHISNLRIKMPEELGQIVSVRGIGYRWEPAE